MAKTKKNSEFFSIYTIWDGDICVYVGSTSREVERRWYEHKEGLKLQKHSNNKLQRLYCECDNEFTYKEEIKVNSDSDLLKYFLEFLYNSLLKPKSNKCVLMQGRKIIVLPRMKDIELVKALINTVKNHYETEKGLGE